MRFPTAIVLAATFSGFASAVVVSSPQAQRSLALALDCSVRGRIQFQVSINGDSDTTVVPGSVVGNGRAYVIDGLELTVRTAQGSNSAFRYSPRRYPVAIGVTVGEWRHPLPAHTLWRISATPHDFLATATRLTAFPSGDELSLRWTFRAPGSDAMLLVSWSGTLASTCRVS